MGKFQVYARLEASIASYLQDIGDVDFDLIDSKGRKLPIDRTEWTEDPHRVQVVLWYPGDRSVGISGSSERLTYDIERPDVHICDARCLDDSCAHPEYRANFVMREIYTPADKRQQWKVEPLTEDEKLIYAETGPAIARWLYQLEIYGE